MDKFEKNNLCPECGSPMVDNMNCWEQLGGIIAWEYDYTDLFAEHFKTVACYNIQHPAQFNDDVITGLKATLIEHLDNGLSVAEIRKRNAKLFEGSKRVCRDIGQRSPILRKWKMTISDVYIPDYPEKAAERVRKWATQIREELGDCK